MYIYIKKGENPVIPKKKTKKNAHSDCTQTLQSGLLHFFLTKRLNFFSFSFLAEAGSGGAADEEEGAGRVWALAPEGPNGSSAAGSWTAFSMAWLQRWSSSWNYKDKARWMKNQEQKTAYRGGVHLQKGPEGAFHN